jgi:hypothetical protein
MELPLHSIARATAGNREIFHEVLAVRASKHTKNYE